MPKSRKLVAALLLATSFLVSCQATRQPIGFQSGSAFTALPRGFNFDSHVRTGYVVVYTAETLTAHAGVVIISAAPDGARAEEILAARLSFVHRASDGYGIRGAPGEVCLKSWPPRGFGPTAPLANFSVRPGDEVAITFYLRFTTSGNRTLANLHILYKDRAGQGFRQDSTQAAHYVLRVRDSLSKSQSGCMPEAGGGNFWLEPGAIPPAA